MSHQIVIIGGGFGGLAAARRIGKRVSKTRDINITVLDRRNHHLFQPLLYQVATAGLSPADIASPIRALLSGYPNIEVQLGEVKRVDLTTKKVVTETREYPYDTLILACGASHSYFGHPEWEEFAPGLKTVEQATEIRRRILLAFEQAERETSLDRRREWLTFVVVGGGATGVELAGSIAEISRTTLLSDFRHITPSTTRVILIEAGPRVLAAFEPSLSQKAMRDLEHLGVQVWTGGRVTRVSQDGVELGTEKLTARTVLWAAGVAPSSLNQGLGSELDYAGRVKVNADLSLPGHPEVFVIGDQAASVDQKGNPLPGVAPVAMQQGRFVADLIVKRLAKPNLATPAAKFQYRDKGMMATIGRRRAVMQFKGIKATGFPAWAAWLFVHIFYLIGFKNRLFVFLQWAWSYFTFKRGARLIVDKDWKVRT